MNTRPYYTEQDVLKRMRSYVSEIGSQRDLATKAGVSQSFVSDVLAGRRRPTGALLQYLGIRAEVLYFPIDE